MSTTQEKHKEGELSIGSAPGPKQTRGGTFAALHYPNYRLWFVGQVVSLGGTWMQNTAQGYLVYELTGSPAYLGTVSFAAGLPSILMLVGGVAADRIPRRSLLMVTQTAMMFLAFTLAALAGYGIVQPWHILVLAVLSGLVNAFDAPARLSLAPELVDREDLTNAIALNATMFNIATVVGPSIAAVVYAAFGPAWCFFINGITFLAVISALFFMQLRPMAAKKAAYSIRDIVQDISEGIRHVLFHNRVVMALMLVMGFFSVFGYSFIPLLPAWAVDILHGDVTTNGILRSAQGVGALISALMIASLGRFRYRGKLHSLAMFAFPITLLIFTTIRHLPLSLVFIAGMGFWIVMLNNLSNSLIQTNVTDELRGRVSSLYSLTFFGLMPIGSLLIGLIAEYMGEPTALSFGAIVLLIMAGLVFWRIPRLRRLE